MRYWWAVLVFAAFVFAVFSSIPSSSGRRCVRVNALGYDGSNGVVIPVTFCVQPGNGRVFVSADHVYGADFQSALRDAVRVFRDRYGLAGKDVFISVGGPPEYLSGRSSALAMYAGLFSAVFGYDPSNYAFTGDIDMRGNVLPVAYVHAKALAFRGSVVVPQGNCSAGLICVSKVSDVERIIASKRV